MHADIARAARDLIIVGLLTVAGRQSRCAWGSVGNEAGAAEFRTTPVYITIFGCGVWRRD